MNYIQNIFSTRQNKNNPLFSALEPILGFRPKTVELYERAFTHRSTKLKDSQGNDFNYERLEYVGDAILGAVIADYLYKSVPGANEGYLTKMRSKIVSRKTLNKLAVEIKLNKLVKYHASAAHQSLYGNALEALIGAICLDKGHHKTSEFIKKTLLLPHLNLNDLTKEVVSYKSKVLEWGQQNKKEVSFKVLESTGKDHKKVYRVALLLEGQKLAEGTGSSIKRAEEQAAQKAQPQLITNQSPPLVSRK